MHPLYTPLLNDTSTRRMILEPGSNQDPLQATLEQIDLGEAHYFEAISYSWGNDQKQKYIIINGVRKYIRHNLWTFLHRLRRRDRRRKLWVDALCISQTNMQEKSQQVGIIGKIFRYARRVLAWVGEHEKESQKLFRDWPTSSTSRHIWNTFSGQRTLSYSERQKRLRVWDHFLNRMYFKRTWIIQEIAVAEEVIVYCGNDAMNWTKLIDSRFDSSSTTLDGIGQKHLTENMLHLDTLRHLREHGGSEIANIFELVAKFGNHLCFDPRDKVYALLSLETSEQRTRPIVADYNKPEIAALFVQVVSQRIHLISPLVRSNGARHINALVRGLKMDSRECVQAVRIVADNAQRDGDDLRKSRHWSLLLDMMAVAMGIDQKLDLGFDISTCVCDKPGLDPICSNAQLAAVRNWTDPSMEFTGMRALVNLNSWSEYDIGAGARPPLVKDAFVDVYDQFEDPGVLHKKEEMRILYKRGAGGFGENSELRFIGDLEGYSSVEDSRRRRRNRKEQDWDDGEYH